MEHPGVRIAQRFMEPLGISPSALARSLDVDRSTVSRLLSGQQPLTVSMAARLGVCFGVPPRWFLDMQAEYDARCICDDVSLAGGATPLEVPPDWLVTPDGVLSLDEDLPTPSTSTVRRVQLDNGAVALLSEAS